MTWSILARDKASGRFGIAVSTCAFAVGARVPFGCGNIGVVATQSFVNPLIGVDGLRLLQEGRTAQETLTIVVAADPGAALRQAHILDRDGNIAAFTGEACVPWCGAVGAANVSVAGNMLANERVIADTLACYLDNPALDFDDRLLLSLEAGERAGGDKRGKQSAALRIWDADVFPVIDMRVDDHADPLNEMRRLWRKAHQRYVPFQACGPTRVNPGGVLDRTALDSFCESYAAAWNSAHPEA
ncbi:MAG: DUF1028 domain-containing protein [Beijerinckiaceae bacterium]